MNDRILVPYDGSEQSKGAFRQALEWFPTGQIVLLHVIEPYTGMPDSAGVATTEYEQRREQATKLLESAIAETDQQDRIETVTAVGRPIHEVLTTIDERGIDEVIIGSHGRDGARRLLLGSVAETVVRRSPVPVTVVHEDQPRVTAPGHVLVPFDGSTAARHALEHAYQQFENATVTALFVLHPPTTATDAPLDTEPSSSLEEWEQTRHEHAETVLSVARDVAADHERSLDTVETGGEPAETILSYVEDNDIEHAVIGSTGRDGLARLLLGSVAETVVRRSPVCVTVVK